MATNNNQTLTDGSAAAESAGTLKMETDMKTGIPETPVGETAPDEIGLNEETAVWLNGQHREIENNERVSLETALGIGERLLKLQESHSGNFAGWIKKNLDFSKSTAYRYISLFHNKDIIPTAGGLGEAYGILKKSQEGRKRAEKAAALERVAEYNETGKKPRGWRRGTDDKLARKTTEPDSVEDSAEDRFIDELEGYLDGIADSKLLMDAIDRIMKICERKKSGLSAPAENPPVSQSVRTVYSGHGETRM